MYQRYIRFKIFGNFQVHFNTEIVLFIRKIINFYHDIIFTRTFMGAYENYGFSFDGIDLIILVSFE